MVIAGNPPGLLLVVVRNLDTGIAYGRQCSQAEANKLITELSDFDKPYGSCPTRTEGVCCCRLNITVRPL